MADQTGGLYSTFKWKGQVEQCNEALDINEEVSGIKWHSKPQDWIKVMTVDRTEKDQDTLTTEENPQNRGGGREGN